MQYSINGPVALLRELQCMQRPRVVISTILYALTHSYRACLSQSGRDSRRTYVVYVGRYLQLSLCTALNSRTRTRTRTRTCVRVSILNGGGVHAHVPLTLCIVGRRASHISHAVRSGNKSIHVFELAHTEDGILAAFNTSSLR